MAVAMGHILPPLRGLPSWLCTRRMISDTCSAVRLLPFLLRTTPDDDTDMGLKSQPLLKGTELDTGCNTV